MLSIIFATSVPVPGSVGPEGVAVPPGFTVGARVGVGVEVMVGVGVGVLVGGGVGVTVPLVTVIVTLHGSL